MLPPPHLPSKVTAQLPEGAVESLSPRTNTEDRGMVWSPPSVAIRKQRQMQAEADQYAVIRLTQERSADRKRELQLYRRGNFQLGRAFPGLGADAPLVLWTEGVMLEDELSPAVHGERGFRPVRQRIEEVANNLPEHMRAREERSSTPRSISGS